MLQSKPAPVLRSALSGILVPQRIIGDGVRSERMKKGEPKLSFRCHIL